MFGAGRGRGLSQIPDFVRMVDDDPSHAVPDGPFQLDGRLCVAVQNDVPSRKAGSSHKFEFPAGDDVHQPALPVQEPHEGPAQEGLAGVRQSGVRSESGAKAGEAILQVAFVDDDQGRPESGSEFRQGHAADTPASVVLRPRDGQDVLHIIAPTTAKPAVAIPPATSA